MMARKRGFLGKALTLGGLAAAGVMIYKNRDLIRGFLDELTAPAEETEDWLEEPEETEAPEVPEDEKIIVIDRTGEE